MADIVLKADEKCVPIQKMVFEKTLGGAPVNSFKPRNTPGEHMRQDGIVYANDICYGEEYPNSHLDIFYADKENSRQYPTVIYIHGGGFIFGDKVSGDPLAEGEGRDLDFCVEIAKRGYNVVSPNYALAPEYRFPVQLKQIDQLLVYLTEHQEEYGLDMERIFLGGGSAGACLTEIYATLLVNPEYAERLEVAPSVRKEQVIGLLVDEAALSVRNYEENMNAMFGCWVGMDDPSENEEVSLLLDAPKWIKDTYFPSFIISSNMEIWFKDSSDDLAEVLEKNGTKYEYFYRERKYDDLEHGFMKRYAGNQYAKECFESMLRFMEVIVSA